MFYPGSPSIVVFDVLEYCSALARTPGVPGISAKTEVMLPFDEPPSNDRSAPTLRWPGAAATATFDDLAPTPMPLLLDLPRCPRLCRLKLPKLFEVIGPDIPVERMLREFPCPYACTAEPDPLLDFVAG